MRRRPATLTRITKECAVWQGGAWNVTRAPDRPERPNFVICCPYGDWSGFRPFQECLDQVMSSLRPDYFYWIEER